MSNQVMLYAGNSPAWPGSAAAQTQPRQSFSQDPQLMKQHQLWLRVDANLKRMRLDRSPFVPATFGQYVEHMESMQPIVNQMYPANKGTLKPIVLDMDLVRWCGLDKELNEQTVSQRHVVLRGCTIFSPYWEPSNDHSVAVWPSEQEFKEEGDERHTSGFGRFLPIPRVPGVQNWKQRAFLAPFEKDQVRPVAVKYPEIPLPGDYEIHEPVVDENGVYVDDWMTSGRISYVSDRPRRFTESAIRDQDWESQYFGRNPMSLPDRRSTHPMGHTPYSSQSHATMVASGDHSSSSPPTLASGRNSHTAASIALFLGHRRGVTAGEQSGNSIALNDNFSHNNRGSRSNSQLLPFTPLAEGTKQLNDRAEGINRFNNETGNVSQLDGPMGGMEKFHGYAVGTDRYGGQLGVTDHLGGRVAGTIQLGDNDDGVNQFNSRIGGTDHFSGHTSAANSSQRGRHSPADSPFNGRFGGTNQFNSQAGGLNQFTGRTQGNAYFSGNASGMSWTQANTQMSENSRLNSRAGGLDQYPSHMPRPSPSLKSAGGNSTDQRISRLRVNSQPSSLMGASHPFDTGTVAFPQPSAHAGAPNQLSGSLGESSTHHGTTFGSLSRNQRTTSERAAAMRSPWRKVSYSRNSFSPRDTIHEENERSESSFRLNRSDVLPQGSLLAAKDFGPIQPPQRQQQQQQQRQRPRDDSVSPKTRDVAPASQSQSRRGSQSASIHNKYAALEELAQFENFHLEE